MASAVVAFKQAVDESTTATLNQRMGVTQLQQPVPEIATSKSTGTPANLLQRNTWSWDRKNKKVDKKTFYRLTYKGMFE